ncbi:hypothetical protein [Aeromicrobium sp. CF3.5]|uniref:hypothetical protein n=1 Tax=Aeromicrobium sp. CF3.5 TaxID=3373078 RepID=UPI003EE4CD71
MKAVAVAVIAALVLLSGCGSDDSADEPEATAPKGFDVPAGVELTPAGTELEIGKPATVVFETGDGAASAITAMPKKVTRGKIKDFEFFSLDEASKKSTPYYVTATVTNDGPAGLGGLGAPFVVHDDTDMIVAPNVINGEFEPCQGGQLPETFLPGDTAELCMVFLVPEGRTLVSIDAVSSDPATAVRWKP